MKAKWTVVLSMRKKQLEFLRIMRKCGLENLTHAVAETTLTFLTNKEHRVNYFIHLYIIVPDKTLSEE